jgi:hypothetical protein
VSTLVSEEQITEIATENRNFASLVALGLGVSSTLPDNNTPTSVGASANISVNGLRQSHNIWLIDGGEADDRGGAGGIDILPSQDAIAQLETLSSNYPPDYGISSGATISLGLKSGTQNFHGEAWEFNRNTAFNANSFQNKNTSGTPTKRAKLNYNIFGANLGGPLFIPGVYPRGKTFFFWNEEWRKLIQGNAPNLQNDLPAADFPTAGQNLSYVSPKFAKTPVVLTVPTVGDPAFAAKLAANCPACVEGQPFPGGVIPAGLFDANAVAYLNSGIVPKPNTANDQFLGQARCCARRSSHQRQVSDSGSLPARLRVAGIPCADGGLVNGQLADDHQHAQQPFKQRGCQADRNHQSHFAGGSKHEL